MAFPGFHDIYQKSYGYIDDRKGKTFQDTLALAMKSDSSLIQIATWNDYGEGTTVEPTVEYGYRYLEAIQKNRTKPGKVFDYTPDDLRLPVRLYKLRKQKGSDPRLQVDLDSLSNLLFEGKLEKAKTLITDLEKGTGEQAPTGDVRKAAPEE